MKCDRRIYVTEDRSRLVEAGDLDGAFVFCTRGHVIPETEIEEHGLSLDDRGRVIYDGCPDLGDSPGIDQTNRVPAPAGVVLGGGQPPEQKADETVPPKSGGAGDSAAEGAAAVAPKKTEPKGIGRGSKLASPVGQAKDKKPAAKPKAGK